MENFKVVRQRWAVYDYTGNIFLNGEIMALKDYVLKDGEIIFVKNTTFFGNIPILLYGHNSMTIEALVIEYAQITKADKILPLQDIEWGVENISVPAGRVLNIDITKTPDYSAATSPACYGYDSLSPQGIKFGVWTNGDGHTHVGKFSISGNEFIGVQDVYNDIQGWLSDQYLVVYGIAGMHFYVGANPAGDFNFDLDITVRSEGLKNLIDVQTEATLGLSQVSLRKLNRDEAANIYETKKRVDEKDATVLAQAKLYTDQTSVATQNWLPSVQTFDELPTVPDPLQTYLCRVVNDPILENNGVKQWVGAAGTTQWTPYVDGGDFVSPLELQQAITGAIDTNYTGTIVENNNKFLENTNYTFEEFFTAVVSKTNALLTKMIIVENEKISGSLEITAAAYVANEAEAEAMSIAHPTTLVFFGSGIFLNGGKIVGGNDDYAKIDLRNILAITDCILHTPNGIYEYSGEGNSITIKAGIEGLISDGRNADYTLKNIHFVNPTDILYTVQSTASSPISLFLRKFADRNEFEILEFLSDQIINTSDGVPAYQDFELWYNPDLNKWFTDIRTQNDWQQIPTQDFIGTSINSIKFFSGPDIFVACTSDGKIGTSTDGQMWTVGAVEGFSGGSINDIAFGAGYFVAVGDDGKIAYSSDAQSWVMIATDPFAGDDIYTVEFPNFTTASYNIFIAAGDKGKMFTAPNPTGTWTTRTSGFGASGKVIRVRAAGTPNTTYLYAVGLTTTASYGIYYSTNSTSWGAITSQFAGTEVRDIAKHPTELITVAVGDGGKMSRSVNNTTFTLVPNTSFGVADIIYSVCWGNDKFYAVGSGGKVAHSPDGLVWTQDDDSSFGSSDIINILFNTDRFIAASSDGKLGQAIDNNHWDEINLIKVLDLEVSE
ncbi:MAG: hypothetical protein LBQ37_02420 [Elusimicrobiota bacterium]|jgi:hypothetical protein|nr:hypothetical protein [Elusimicrobiota bacterium]